MKSLQLIFALLCLFITRIIAFSGSFADAVCLIAILAYLVCLKVLDQKQINKELVENLNSSTKKLEDKVSQLSSDIDLVKNQNDSIKAAVGFARR
jgi:Skp family chaperone for outer membrane proteins